MQIISYVSARLFALYGFFRHIYTLIIPHLEKNVKRGE